MGGGSDMVRDRHFDEIAIERQATRIEVNHRFQSGQGTRFRSIDDRDALLVPTPASPFRAFSREIISLVIRGIGGNAPDGVAQA